MDRGGWEWVGWRQMREWAPLAPPCSRARARSFPASLRLTCSSDHDMRPPFPHCVHFIHCIASIPAPFIPPSAHLWSMMFRNATWMFIIKPMHIYFAFASERCTSDSVFGRKKERGQRRATPYLPFAGMFMSIPIIFAAQNQITRSSGLPPEDELP